MNARQRQYPFLDKISDYVSYYAQKQPEKDALVINNDRLTYSELTDRVDEIARSLIAAGVQKGDRVATLSTPHPDFFVIFLATVSIGAIWVGLNPKYQIDEYRFVLNETKPVILFSRTKIEARDYRNDLKILQDELPTLRKLVVLGDDPLCDGSGQLKSFISNHEEISDRKLTEFREKVERNDPALIVFTSGSTGQPKGAILPHRGLVRCSITQLSYWNCDPLSLINYLPINHIGCVGDLSCYCLVGGGTLIFQEQFDPSEVLEIIEREKITFLGGVPTALQMLLSATELSQSDLSSVQLAIWSGASAPRSLVEQLLKLFPLASNAYGMTESVGSVTFAGPNRDIDILTDTIGRPVPDYDVRIVKLNGEVAEPGEEGEVHIRGDFIMKGYWHRPDATADTIDNEGWLHTGDLAVERSDGYYKLVGRLKEMFISGGYNVFPREIEKVIEKHPSIAMAAVIGVPDDLYGEVGIAFAMLKPDAKSNDHDLRKFCRERLANYKVPKKFIISKSFPMLPIGKIDKNKLRKQLF